MAPSKIGTLVLAIAGIFSISAGVRPHPLVSENAIGRVETYVTAAGRVAAGNEFFRPLGSNGRSCSSCHSPAQGWTIGADEVRSRFEATNGRDPIFRAADGANCDHGLDTSTLQRRRAAYSLLTQNGLIRVALAVPRDAEFEVVKVDNPYGCGDRNVLSLYRRPLPVTNLRALTEVMWDGRGSSVRTGTQPINPTTNPADLVNDLAQQVEEAARIHLQVSHRLSARQRESIVQFEMGLATAQAFDLEAGALNEGGAKGGPTALAKQFLPAFVVGINDSPTGDPHSIRPEDAFRLYDAWSNLPYGRVYNQFPPAADAQGSRRTSIARGQVLFDQKPFDITNVPGFNDEQHLPSITGACGTCHDSPNLGNHSVGAFLKIGVDDRDSSLDVAYLPAITLSNKRTHETIVTTDPGLALVTGLWKDVGKMKVPTLRGLAARSPYFHNGGARSLADVVGFYDRRFQIHLSAQEKADLIAFLSVL
jgi:cytochrome c peroxidase